MSDTLRTLSADMWAILSAKSDDNAKEQLESCTQGEGVSVYVRIHYRPRSKHAEGSDQATSKAHA